MSKAKAMARSLHGAPPFALAIGSSEHYLDAALYDFEYRRRRADVNFYRGLARQHLRRGDPALELGCGSGRLTIPLARDGHLVLGLDLSAPMLARAQARAASLGRAARNRVAFARADFRSFAVAPRFRLIACPFNAFQHLYTAADVQRFLGCVRAALAPGGLFVFDVLNPDLRWLSRDPTRRWARTRFRHPETGRRYEYSTNQTYDPIAQIAYMRIYYRALDGGSNEGRGEGQGQGQGEGEGGGEHIVRLAHRQFFPAELMQLVRSAGLLVIDRYGGFQGEALEDGSESQLLLCVSGDQVASGQKK